MRSPRVFRLALAAVVTAVGSAGFLGASPAAKASPLLALHQKMKVGGKLCLATHRHTGFARRAGSKRAVARAAMADWRDFTTMEYGAAWGSFRRGHDRRVSCQRANNGWSCTVSALPCRR